MERLKFRDSQRQPWRALCTGLLAFAAGVALLAPAMNARAQGDNLALTATASASTEFPGGGFEATRTNDGKDSTRWNDDCSEADSALELDWASPQIIGTVVIKQAYDRIKDYAYDRWDTTKNDWVEIFTGKGPGSGRIDINVDLTATISPPVTTTKLRLRMTGKSCASIYEWQVFAPEKNNLALSATATASSDIAGGGFEPTRANDGKDTTRWNDDCAETAPTFTLTWPQAVTFNEVIIEAAYDRLKKYRLEAFDTTKNDFVQIFEGTAPGTGRIDINVTDRAALTTPVTTTQLRFVTEDKVSCLSFYEFEVYNTKFGTVTGKVTDESGAALAGATVASGDVAAQTDASGNYTLILDPGTVDVQASDDPIYKPRVSRGIALAENATVQRNITLVKKPDDLAKGAAPSTSSEATDVDMDGNPLYDSAKLDDGDLTTRWGSTEGEGAVFGVSWDTAKTFNRVLVHEYGNVITGLSLQTSDGQSDFKEIAKQTFVPGSGNPVLQISLPSPVTAKQLQLVVTGFSTQPGFSTVSVNELEVQNAALGTLNGTVVNGATSAPVANAAVLDDSGSTLAIADANGTFSVLLDADDYALSATSPDYFAGKAVIATVDTGKTSTVTIPIPPKGANLALVAKATADSEDTDNAGDAINVNDKNLDTFWGALALPASLTLTWGSPVTFNRVVIEEFGDRSREISIQAFDTAKNAFVEVGSAASPGGGADVDIEHVVDTKSPVTTTQLMITVPTGANPPRFREVQVYNFSDVVVPPATVKGDLNGDGKVNIADATMALQFAVGNGTPTAAQISAGDVVGGDGKIGIPDVTKILQAAIGAIQL